MRLLVFLTNLVPYHVARWGAVVAAGHQVLVAQRRCGDSFPVLETSVTSASFPVHTLAPASRTSKDLLDHIRSLVGRVRPDLLVVSGWSDTESLAALIVAAEQGLPVVMCSESNSHDAPRRPWSEWVKGRVLRQAQGALVGGTSHRDYLIELGMSPGAIFLGYNAVDNDHFASAERWRAEATADRSRLGLPGRFLLAVSRFTSKKNLTGLIDGYGLWLQSSGNSNELQLVILGDGPLRGQLLARRTSLGLEESLHLPGPCGYADLPARYGLAEAFIHASTVEQWGLVVNEAMAAGLPVLVSSACGCAADLVNETENGRCFDPVDPAAIAAAIDWLASRSDAERRRMGESSQRIIQNYGRAAFATGFEAAARHALSAERRRLGGFDRLLLQRLMHRQLPDG